MRTQPQGPLTCTKRIDLSLSLFTSAFPMFVPSLSWQNDGVFCVNETAPKTRSSHQQEACDVLQQRRKVRRRVRPAAQQPRSLSSLSLFNAVLISIVVPSLSWQIIACDLLDIERKHNRKRKCVVQRQAGRQTATHRGVDCGKRLLFSAFPDACPEPVLVNWSFSYVVTAPKRAFSARDA